MARNIPNGSSRRQKRILARCLPIGLSSGVESALAGCGFEGKCGAVTIHSKRMSRNPSDSGYLFTKSHGFFWCTKFASISNGPFLASDGTRWETGGRT